MTQRLPRGTVFTEAGGLSADGDAVVEIDVQCFDADAEGRVTLLAQAAVRRPSSRRVGQTRAVRLEVPARMTATADIVAAMSVMLGQFADAVVAMLRAL